MTTNERPFAADRSTDRGMVERGGPYVQPEAARE